MRHFRNQSIVQFSMLFACILLPGAQASGQLIGAEAGGQETGARFVTEHGNEDCIELFNETTRVVLEPNLGGRVLVYALNGKNVLWINQENEGKPYVEGEPYGYPGAGRFDYGPEQTGPKSSDLFFGPWKAEITGAREAAMYSEMDPVSGVTLERRFKLEKEGSHLTCTQIIKNTGEGIARHYHWSRTFVKGGGISLTPLNPHSKYPEGYLHYGPGRAMNFEPGEEPNIRKREGILEIIGPPSRRKFVMDCEEGWLGYITLDNQLFIKKFKIFPDRPYWDMAAPTVSIWYNSDTMCEIEPMGPLEILEPGEAAAFTEHWFLYDYSYPVNRVADLKEVRRYIRDSMP